MKMGELVIHPLHLGFMKVCGGPVFGIIPRKIWSQWVQPDEDNRITIGINSLLIVSKEAKVILDTGFGDKYNAEALRSYGVTEIKTIAEAIKPLGYYSGDITHCILSHLHLDHSGGCTKKESGKIVPAFPNAVYYIQEKEYDDAISPTMRTRATYLPENFEPLYEEGKLHLMAGLETILPFLSGYPVEGHVNAMNIIRIETGERTIYYPGDLIGQKELVHPLCNSAYDYYPLKSEQAKVELLERCLFENAWLFLPHDPSCSFFSVEKHSEYKYVLHVVNQENLFENR